MCFLCFLKPTRVIFLEQHTLPTIRLLWWNTSTSFCPQCEKWMEKLVCLATYGKVWLRSCPLSSFADHPSPSSSFDFSFFRLAYHHLPLSLSHPLSHSLFLSLIPPLSPFLSLTFSLTNSPSLSLSLVLSLSHLLSFSIAFSFIALLPPPPPFSAGFSKLISSLEVLR